MNYNHIVLAGRLTDTPELKSIGNKNTSLATFSIAVNDSYRDEVFFFNCQLFGKGAETFCKYVQKGQVILVGGSLTQQRWDAKDGSKRSKIVINVRDFQFGAKAKENTSTTSYTGKETPDDIPF